MVRTFPVKIKKIKPNAAIPTYGSMNAAGADLYACIDSALVIHSGETILVPTGLKAYMPEDEVLILANRSSNTFKRNLSLPNGVSA